MGDGADVELTVVAITQDQPGFETILLPAMLLAAHTTSGLPSQILVRANAGVTADALQEAVRQAVRSEPGVEVRGRDALLAQHRDREQVGAWVNYLIVGVLTVYTVISVVNTLMMSAARRRREFGLQRLVGSSRGQILRMMTVEGAMVAVIGIILGIAVSCSTLVPFSMLVKGSPFPTGPPAIYLTIIGAAAALAILATVLPVLRVTRIRPAAAALADD